MMKNLWSNFSLFNHWFTNSKPKQQTHLSFQNMFLLKSLIFTLPLISAPVMADFEEERRISEKTRVYSALESRTDIAFNSNGDGAVVWYNDEYVSSVSYERIYLQRLKQDGSANGLPIVVSTDMDAEQKYPSVGIDELGDIVVTWAITPETDPLTVMARQYNSNGSPKGSEFQVHEDSEGNHYTPDLLVNPDGTFTVVWSSGMNDGFGDVYKRSFNADGSPIDSSTIVNTTTSYSQTKPVISANSLGDLVIGWEAQGMGSSWDIAFRIYDENGQSLSSEIFANNDNYNNFQKDTAVAIDDLGNITVAWYCFCDGDGTGIKARRFDALGNPVTSSFTVNTYIENNQTNPAIAMQNDGKSLMTWTGRYTGQSGSTIFGQYIDSDGSFLGDEFIVSNAQTESDNYFSRTNSVVHVDEYNIYRVAWSATQSGVSNMGVFYTQRDMVKTGEDQIISSNTQTVNLSAENHSPLQVDTWLWQQTSGNIVDILNESQMNASFQSPQENGVLTFKVTATYTDGSQATDTINIEVAADIPDVNAGEDFTVLEGNTANMAGTASATGSGSIVSYLWEQVSGPLVDINNATSLHPSFVAPFVTEDTELVFSLLATDSEGNEGQDQISITVENINQAPVVDAGIDFSADENTIVSLNALASDEDNNIISYLWQQTSGPLVNLSNANTLNASFMAPEVTENTTLTFSFTATDSEGDADSDSINIIIQHVNKIPTVNAGTAQMVFDGSVVQLSGFGNDIDGTIVTYNWQQISGIPVSILNENSAIASFTAPEVTNSSSLVFRLTVTDNDSATAYADTQVSITDDESNQAPTAYAGVDQSVTSNALVSLQGSASDDTGIEEILWEQISGPLVTIASANDLATQFVAPSVVSSTNIIFRLTVTDTFGLTDSDEITVTVTPASINYCSLRGNSTSYEWIQSISFAGQANVSNSNGGYEDFTSLGNMNVIQGQSYSIQLQPGFRSGSSYNEYWYVWIDLNQDGQFDAVNEQVFSGSSRSTLNGNINIPSSAALGNTRMRIAMKYGSSAPSTCGQYTYGEVEDYTINITQ